MTTINHTAVAGIVAMAVVNEEISVKVVAVLLLALSHLVFDAIPHEHFYKFEQLRETFLGAIIELGVGLLILPVLVWHFTGIDPIWLAICVISSSLVDFLVVAKISAVGRLNMWAHWWDGKVSRFWVIIFEIGQTTILLMVLGRQIF